MNKLFKWLGFTTEKWAANVVVAPVDSYFRTVYKPTKPMVDVYVGEEYDCISTVSAFWLLTKPILVLRVSENIEPFSNPKETPFRKRV